ncbi:hypothetical protein EXIGLDRAFT_709040 [Exidia glandulosa HHB12029]|uniref:Uncharacterized protein n=1 Tax=Exidia glandulosa HHB12029 TaxID=1314781 RepID=A0A165J2N0_EXIGL|nr:hypothetical protein EXIGLDRAFT_709040 [Exidia glandulosa HHB12029]
MTLAATHSLKRSGLALLRQRIKSAEAKHFVFVIPKGRSFSIVDPTLGKPKHMLASQMSYWVLEIPLSPEYETVLDDMKEAWDADPSLQRVEMEDLVNVPTDVEMEIED